jgi:hypothetical protein
MYNHEHSTKAGQLHIPFGWPNAGVDKIDARADAGFSKLGRSRDRTCDPSRVKRVLYR